MKVPPIQSVQWFYGAFSFREAEVLLFYWLWAVPLNNLTTTCNIEPKTGVFAILCCALISMHIQHCLEYVVLQGGTKHCLSELPGLKILCFAQILCRDTDHIPRDAVVPSVSWLEFSFVLASCIYLLTKAQSVDPQVLKWTPVNLSVCWYLLRDDSANRNLFWLLGAGQRPAAIGFSPLLCHEDCISANHIPSPMWVW